MSMGNINPNLFRQAQTVQKRLVELREELKDRVVEGAAGGGLVTAFTNGNGELVKISIRKDAVDPADPEGVRAAFAAARGYLDLGLDRLSGPKDAP